MILLWNWDYRRSGGCVGGTTTLLVSKSTLIRPADGEPRHVIGVERPLILLSPKVRELPPFFPGRPKRPNLPLGDA